ncbi:probable metal-dependent peptidase [hydrothermal vent metagenome]|uniref:Probable metal-dependent peptidase n=1 Tax=hydrothermal vent metagenome TaxID=652676 RepID=A0A3B0ZCP3_9ZZZZ
MPYALALVFIIILLYSSQWWVKYTLNRYATTLEHLEGTGGELARHLLDRFEMQDVKVEIDDRGDHYDPVERAVRLSSDNFNKKSLTAIAVATHEVGHAIQHHRKEPLLALRTRLVKVAMVSEKLGSLAFILMPIVVGITRVPQLSFILIGAVILSMLVAVIVHFVTLPVEWDASFGKALPILEEGYIQADELVAVKKVLRAAALTYVAASLAGVLNLWRWLALLRR